MNIERFNADFGNSTNNFMVDGQYFEFPTNVVNISKKKAEEYFVDTISEAKDLIKRMLISIGEGEEERFYLVGEEAEKQELANSHVSRMHDKINSNIPYVSFLAAVVYYHALKSNADEEEKEVNIDSMSMMLPIWIQKREAKFSIAQQKMASRFANNHIVKVLTPGMQRELKVIVKEAKCRTESEIARHSLKYKMVRKDGKAISIEKRKEAEKFDNCQTVLTDIGGGSTDAVLLAEGLATPRSRDSFQVIDIQPFLGYLEAFRKEKLLEFFADLRGLEKFIIQKHRNQEYILENPNTGATSNLTEQVTEALRDYAQVLVQKVIAAFVPSSSEVGYKFVYFGGEAPILEPYIREALKSHMTEEAVKNNHFFLSDVITSDEKEEFAPTPRTINICALELLSVDQIAKQKA